MDIDKWMDEGLIDIWVTPGYFRLQEWEDMVKFSHADQCTRLGFHR